MEQDELMTTEEVGRLLKKSPETVRQMIRDGKIPAKKIGRSWYVWRSWILKPSNQKRSYA